MDFKKIEAIKERIKKLKDKLTKEKSYKKRLIIRLKIVIEEKKEQIERYSINQ
jgi:hypothetical protein